MKASDIVIATLILVANHPAPGAAEESYLTGEALIALFADATLIGSNWAEYYAPDGTITGKVRYLGLVHSFTGRWIVTRDLVCFEYQSTQYNTCSRFRQSGDQMRHYGADGKPKRDGESRRLAGNRLEEFR
jgi:hypothetical protein